MRAAWLVISTLAATALTLGVHGQAGPAPSPVVTVDFSNPEGFPSRWTLKLHPDGSGHFHMDQSKLPANELVEMDAPDVDRKIQVSPEFAERVFQVAQQHNWFNQDCESHLKVAFQGWKKLSFSGPAGQGSCTFNYSKDKDIQALGDSLMGVAETLREGARLEMLMQHDRLGLDKEMEYLTEAAKDGRMRQICTIREILERLEGDQEVLERVRKRARALLTHPGT
jgi:hypothetical protein